MDWETESEPESAEDKQMASEDDVYRVELAKRDKVIAQMQAVLNQKDMEIRSVRKDAETEVAKYRSALESADKRENDIRDVNLRLLGIIERLSGALPKEY